MIECPKCLKECEGEAPREKRPYWLHCECECGFQFCYDENTSVYYDMDGKIISRTLTLEALKKMKPGIFARGLATDGPGDINMTNSGKQLRWVAVRGGMHDWTIYCHWSYNSEEWIRRQGDKVCNENHIRKLVQCSDDAFAMYRY